MEHLQRVLEETFAANFVSYYRLHQFHVNVRGREFYQLHKLFKHQYQTLQDHIDDLAEKLRTIGGEMPRALDEVIALSPIVDKPVDGDAEELVREALDTVLILIDQYHELRSAADEVDYTDISNMADENIGELAKMKWQLEATLDE
jgi:starvation-inducible DNA-binding protein